MKKRAAALVMAVMMMCSVLAGCGNKKGNVVTEARKGVVRVVARYYTEVYQVDPITGKYEFVNSGMQMATGSAFGVGSAGEKTDIFVTNRHVVESQFTEYAAGDTYTDEFMYIGALESVYILKDDYAFSSTSGIDTSRAVPCDVIYCGDEDEPDLAVLQAAEEVEGRVAMPLLSEKDEIEAGDGVYALGFPGSTDQTNTIIWGQDDSSGDSGSYGSVEVSYVRDVLDDLRIPYDVYKGGHSALPIVLVIVAVAAVLLIAAVVLLRKRSATVKVAAGATTPANPPFTPPIATSAPSQPQPRPNDSAGKSVSDDAEKQ